MNNAWLHVCISIIQTNHYIYSIIFIMNYSPAWSARWQPGRRAWVWMKVAGLIVEWFLKRGGNFLKCIFVHKRAKGPFPPLSPSPGQSGRGRRRWDSSSWRRQETTRPCRGCSRRRTSIRRAWCPTWTPERPSTSTGAPRRPRRPCRDPWCRASSCTACREAASRRLRRLLSPPCPACFPGRLSSGEPAPAEFRSPAPLTPLPTYLNMPTFLQLRTHSKKRSKRQRKIRE